VNKRYKFLVYLILRFQNHEYTNEDGLGRMKSQKQGTLDFPQLARLWQITTRVACRYDGLSILTPDRSFIYSALDKGL